MDDLISRQAAIDVFMKILDDPGHAEFLYTDEICKALSDLPPAKPEIIRCKDCKHRIVNEHAGEKGYLNLKAMCELDTDDPFELGRNAEDDEWFCADAERRAEDSDD